jgi:predicted 3-demethylubiquinone-9 3-methyltransferase (glyoxalase superfamily)
MHRPTPFLWFNDNAEQAADFYLSIFPNARKLKELRATTAGPGPEGSLIVIELEIEGEQISLMNGGPAFQLTQAFSLFIRCDRQEEIDTYWDKFLAAGAVEHACGWLTDHFGLSWQIAPTRILDFVSTPGGMQAMMAMKKLDIAALEKAASA